MSVDELVEFEEDSKTLCTGLSYFIKKWSSRISDCNPDQLQRMHVILDTIGSELERLL